MKIAFVHNSNAFLPELEAYTQYFSALKISCDSVRPEVLVRSGYDVAWFFMGIDRSPHVPGMLKIHEYGSASIPPFSKLKNKLKSILNPKPDYRIFLNEYVKDALQFRDDIAFGFRNMGVALDREVMQHRPDQPIYDFVYIGDLSASREPHRLFDFFTTGTFRKQSLLVIGKNYAGLQEKYASYPNIHFEGPYAQATIKTHLRKARFGLNYMPNREPFNQQTSTKLLEYAAAGLPIVSTDYCWVRDFERTYNGRFFYISQPNEPIEMEALYKFQFKDPDLRMWTWERQLQGSGVLSFIEAKQGRAFL